MNLSKPLYFSGVLAAVVLAASACAAGSIQTFSVPRCEQIQAAEDNTAWCLNRWTATAYRVKSNGEIAHYSLRSLPEHYVQFVAAPDGTLYYAVPSGEAVVRIGSSGVISEYELPAIQARLEAIAMDSRHTLWLATCKAKVKTRLQQLLLANTLNSDPCDKQLDIEHLRSRQLLEHFREPERITALAVGGDGAVWLVPRTNNPTLDHVWRMAPGGSLRRFALGKNVEYLADIIADNAGNAWIIEKTHSELPDRIASIAPNGSLRELAIPLGTGTAEHLSQAPNGDIFFAYGTGGEFVWPERKVERMTPAGVFSEIWNGCPGAVVRFFSGCAAADGVAAEGDHFVWISVSNKNEILRVKY